MNKKEGKTKDLQEKEIQEVLDKGEKALKETIEILKDIKQEKVFTNIKKIKCDYTVYKRERTNCKMPVQKECAKCGKKFKEGDELYIANCNEKDCIICSRCVNKGE